MGRPWHGLVNRIAASRLERILLKRYEASPDGKRESYRDTRVSDEFHASIPGDIAGVRHEIKVFGSRPQSRRQIARLRGRSTRPTQRRCGKPGGNWRAAMRVAEVTIRSHK
jgi:hypothetical protein